MENNLKNLPPFYVGQKVVCLIGNGWVEDVNRYSDVAGPSLNEVVTVIGCYWGVEGLPYPEWCVELKEYPPKHVNDGYMVTENPSRSPVFKPIQESPFPPLTFKEVIEKEKVLTCNN